MGNFASIEMGAFSKRPYDLKNVIFFDKHLNHFSNYGNIASPFQICFGRQELKFLLKGLVPFYQEFLLITSASLITFVLNY